MKRSGFKRKPGGTRMKRGGFKPKMNADGTPRSSSFSGRSKGFADKVRKPMKVMTEHRVERLNANAKRKADAIAGGYYRCEIRSGLIERGYLRPEWERCRGRLTFCHARTKTNRQHDAAPGTPEHEDTGVYGCWFHHSEVLDIPDRVPRAVSCEIVMEAIARRLK